MNLLIIIILAAILQYVAPWWTAALVPFLVLLWRPSQTSFGAFLTGFAAIGLLWLVYGLYLHSSSEGALSNQIATIFSLPNGILLLLITVVVGGLVGGFASLTGFFLRKSTS